MDDRTRSLAAAATAAVIVLAVIAGVGVLLGFPVRGSLTAAAMAALASALLMVGASRRAASFAPDPTVSSDPERGSRTDG